MRVQISQMGLLHKIQSFLKYNAQFQLLQGGYTPPLPLPPLLFKKKDKNKGGEVYAPIFLAGSLEFLRGMYLLFGHVSPGASIPFPFCYRSARLSWGESSTVVGDECMRLGERKMSSLLETQCQLNYLISPPIYLI